MKSPLAGALTALAVALMLSACGDGGGSHEPPRVPAALEVSGDWQTALVGTAVAVPPQVRVLTTAGEPVPGVSVTFTPAAGSGTVTGGSQVTDANGIARVGSWTLGTVTGPQRLTISAGTLSAPISATATPGPPAGLVLETAPPATILSGFVFAPQPVVAIVDAFQNRATDATAPVTASLASGTGTLAGTLTVVPVLGRAVFSDLSIEGSGEHQLQFAVGALPSVTTPPFAVSSVVNGACEAPGGLALDLPLGQTVRRTMTAGSSVDCLEFDIGEAAGEQYLVLFEHLPVLGSYDAALFAGFQNPTSFTATLTSLPATFDASPAQPVPLQMNVVTDPPVTHRWNFGGDPIYEAQVAPPPGGVREVRIVRDGALIAMSSALVEPQVGDTLVVFLEGIPRLSIDRGDQRAVIRYISPELVFAEDVRLPTLLREGGTTNTPMTMADMAAIATEYAGNARVRADALFEGRHNSATEAGVNVGGRVLAVHTLMFADNIWGYTYSSTDYFVFDFWVGTNGSTKGFSQIPQRVADDLFMHEIAHMRHWGMLERAGLDTPAQRGNRWLVEGFARFTERLPIAARLLNTSTPSRTSNLVLPMNPVFNGSYYFDDVPTYLSASASMFGGYSASAYVFDYFADLVAASGADPLPALRDFLLNAGSQTTLDAAVARWVPGLTFAELFTRARIALYTDDIGVAGLPAATQYQQFQLRASRPPGQYSANDPRNAWPKLVPGVLASQGVSLPAGAAFGFLIDGTAAPGSGRIDINSTQGEHAVISITRIR